MAPLFRTKFNKVRDLNGNSSEPAETKYVFALLEKSKALDDRGPIASLYASIKAAQGASDPRKYELVRLRDTRAWQQGDRPNPKSDIVYEEKKVPGWGGIYS
jgi:hypothetical protein